jgi:hypothetical protein
MDVQLDDNPLPLARFSLQPKTDPQALIAQGAAQIFPNARHPQAALAGLLLKQGFWEESHEIAQDIDDPEGSYWHAIIHRLEPDPANSGYWFRRVGQHAIFPALQEQAKAILLESGISEWRLKAQWDPFRFNEWCDQARQLGGQTEAAAVAIQTAEWRLLFGWCSEPA